MTKPVWPDMYKIVETDNFGGDYPNEKEVNLRGLTKEQAEHIAEAINSVLCKYDDSRRYWKVVPVSYELLPGFEP